MGKSHHSKIGPHNLVYFYVQSDIDIECMNKNISHTKRRRTMF